MQEEILKIKMQNLSDLLPQYIGSFAIYITITGGLLKFALDTATLPEQRRALIIFGVALSFLGLLTCAFGWLLQRSIMRDIKGLNSRLGLPTMISSFLPLVFATALVSIFVTFCLAGWFYLLMR